MRGLRPLLPSLLVLVPRPILWNQHARRSVHDHTGEVPLSATGFSAPVLESSEAASFVARQLVASRFFQNGLLTLQFVCAAH